MTQYRLTYQGGLDERPICTTFDTKEEAEEMAKDLKRYAEEKRIPWKLEPTIEVER